MTGCSALQLDVKDQAAVRSVFDQVRRGDLARIQSELSPELNTPTTLATLTEVSALIPKTAPTQVRRVSWQIFKMSNTRTISTLDEYRYPQGVIKVTTGLRLSDGRPPVITTFYVKVVNAVDIERARFTLKGKSAAHYLVLALTVAAPAITVFALVRLFTTRGVRRRWLWALGMILGVGSVTFNWTTGAGSVRPLYFQVFSAGVSKLGAAGEPWMISFAIPVVAIVFLLRRRAGGTEAGSAASSF